MSRRWLTLIPALLLAALLALPAAAANAAAGPTARSMTKVPRNVVPKAACVEDPFTMCLLGGRFEVIAAFRTNDGTTGDAEMVRLTDESGYMWFFAPQNIEVVAKVIDGCPLNSAFWFFAAGLTNVEVAIDVRDTVTGVVASYHNPPNRAFQPIQDTSALFTCP